MKRTITGFILIFFFFTSLHAQKQLVLLDPQQRAINQGEPLPPQTYFTIQVPVDMQTGIITINLFKGNKTSDLIQQNSWSRPINFKGNIAEVPVNVKLRNNGQYGFEVLMYSILSDSERTSLKETVHQNLTNYLNATIEATGKKINMEGNSGKVINNLNAVVKRSLTWYNNVQLREFEGFSDVVKFKVLQLQEAKLADARFNLSKSRADTLPNTDEMQAAYAKQLTGELQGIVMNEIDNYLNLDFVKLFDSFVIRNAVTERSQTVLPLFVGYGGVYFNGTIDDLEYDSQPYAGFSFPIGRGNEMHYGRTSFILGIFLKDFKDGQGNTISGPVINKPLFTGLGFRIYDFINLNAGVVATSTTRQTITNIKTEEVQLKPFVGLNVQFNLWLGLKKK